MAIVDRRGVSVSGVDTPIAGNPNPDLAWKAPVKVATTGSNITLSGLPVIDGYQTVAGDRVLVKDETDQTTNGLYNASSGNWTRTIDAANNSQFAKGMQVVVTNGTINAGLAYQLTTADPTVLGTSNITWQLTQLTYAVVGNLHATGTLIVDSTSTLTGNTTVGGTFGVTGAATLSSTLGVTGNATVGGTLGVTGASTFTGATTHNGGLTGTTATLTGALTQMSGANSYGLLANGTTAQRPSNVEGRFRYNTDNHIIEWFNGTSWITPLTTGTPATAVGKCSLAMSVVAGNVSSSSSSVVTHSTSHGLASGQLIWSRTGTLPTGWTANAAYYVGVVSPTTYKIYTTLAGALAVDGTNVSLTNGSGFTGSLIAAVVSVSANSGLATNPFQFTCGQTAIAGTVTVSTAMTSASGWMAVLNWSTSEALSSTSTNGSVMETASQTSTVATWSLVSGANAAVSWPTTAAISATATILFQGYNG